MGIKFLAVWLGLSIGNLIYALVDQQGTEHAFERSFFQGTALLSAWLVVRTARAS